tara:strand:- start:1591 stop:2706 length:1116 start_codon:yes stop_codon:yes gene_type:complete
MSANSVHVINQCDGFRENGCDVVLSAKRSTENESELNNLIKETYGISTNDWKINTFYSKNDKANNIKIAFMALWKILIQPSSIFIISRNLYASLILAFIGKRFVFETHQLEIGFRKRIQEYIIKKNKTKTVVISDRLSTLLAKHHNLEKVDCTVLHDAASGLRKRVVKAEQIQVINCLTKIPLEDLNGWDAICGYFGQLSEGRGIEIICGMAKSRPKTLFIVFGGNSQEVQEKSSDAPNNLYFLGYVANSIATEVQTSVDVLLMPYQKSVSIGIRGHDTAQWMSPVKMFEYMSTGVPIISSDLPVLREVLIHEENALLVQPDDVADWVGALDRIIEDKNFGSKLGIRAQRDINEKYTWKKRAENILRLMQD